MRHEHSQGSVHQSVADSGHKNHHAAGAVRVNKFLKAGNYRLGGRVKSDEAEDKAMIKSAVHKHEKHMHKGEKETKLKSGGDVHGMKPKARMDRMARGGRPTRKGHTQVNVLIGGNKDAGNPMKPPMPIPVPAAASGPMPAPMMGPRPMPGGMPGEPPMKRGGSVRKLARGGNVGEDNAGDSPHGNRPAPKMTAGALSGKGRIEKGKAYGGSKKKSAPNDE